VGKTWAPVPLLPNSSDYAVVGTIAAAAAAGGDETDHHPEEA